SVAPAKAGAHRAASRLWKHGSRPSPGRRREEASWRGARDAAIRPLRRTPPLLGYAPSSGSSRPRFQRGSRQHTWPSGHGATGREAGRDLWLWCRGPGVGRRRRCLWSSCPPPDRTAPVEAFLVSTGLVALSELGDKTQLLAMVLSARFRQPVPIILAILV